MSVRHQGRRRAAAARVAGRVRSQVRSHRRLLAGALIAVAAGIAVDAATTRPPVGVPVVTAAADLAAGTVLSVGDLAVVEAPADMVPDGRVSADDADGRSLAAPLRRGEVVTDARLVGPGLLTGQPDGTVAVPVRPSDPAVTGLLRAGDRVRVLAGPDPADPDAVLGGGDPAVLVPSATVLAVPPDSAGGLLATGASAVLVLAVRGADAPGLAAAGEARWLSVALLP